MIVNIMNSKFNNLIRDIEEGIIVVNKTGTIMHINPKANKILELKKDYESFKFVSLVEDDTQNNDAFNQMIIEAVNEPKEYETLNNKLKELTEEELKLVTGGTQECDGFLGNPSGMRTGGDINIG